MRTINYGVVLIINGRIVEDFIQCNDFILLNDGSHTRLDPHTGQFSSLDLTIVSNELAVIADWHVIDENFGSDHLVISYNLKLGPSKHNCPLKVTPAKWSFKDANWELYRKKVIKQLNVLDQTEYKMLNIQGKYDYFVQSMLFSADIMFSKKGKKHQHLSPVSWWNEEIQDAIKVRNVARNKFEKKTLLFVDLEIYLKKKAYAQKVKRKVQK